MYKMSLIPKETWKKCGIEVINDIYINSIYFWLNEKHIETGMGHSNLAVVTNKYGPKYKIYWLDLVDKPNYQPFRRFDPNYLAEKLVKTIRADKADVLKRSIGFNLIDTFRAKQQTLTKTIKKAFKGEDIQTEYSVLGYRIDLYFYKYRLAIEVDDFGHSEILTMK